MVELCQDIVNNVASLSRCEKVNMEDCKMQTVSRITPLFHSSLPGVRVFPIAGQGVPKRGVPQTVLVQVDPGVAIPKHKHGGDAYMTIVAGTAKVVSEDAANGQEVGPGFCVFYAKQKLHGFVAGLAGFSFITKNEGIVDADGNWDMQDMHPAVA